MEPDLLDRFAGFILFAWLLIFVALVIVVPISVYSAQKWAYRCFQGIEEANTLLREQNTYLRGIGALIEEHGERQREDLARGERV